MGNFDVEVTKGGKAILTRKTPETPKPKAAEEAPAETPPVSEPLDKPRDRNRGGSQ